MRSRLFIFSFYDRYGYVDLYVKFLLNEILNCAGRLIIVVNGEISESGFKVFKSFTREIYIKDNKGYDAGAYRHVLVDILSEEEINTYDEVILCNDTFFGPFVSLSSIMSRMDGVECDFWGLNGYFGVVFAHIQSYFLVFRKEVLKEYLLTDYFRNYIDPNTTELKDVYCQFEVGLFDFLAREHKKKYAIYALENNYDIYRQSFFCIRDFKLPIVKRKVFSYYQTDRDNILCTLSYIKYHTNYSLTLILGYIKQMYGLEFNEEDIKSLDSYELPQRVELPQPVNNEDKIEKFIKKQEFYIYGTGIYACKTYWRFARNNKQFKGFIVSNEKRGENNYLYGYPIYEFSEVADIYEKKIILGVCDTVTNEIVLNFDNMDNVLRIF